MKKNHIILILCFVLMSVHLTAQSYSGGAGTEASPYQIATKADLKYLSENSGEWGKHFEQTADIIFEDSDFESGGDFYNDGLGFNPIGYNSYGYDNHINYFSGSYNGNDHIISGLTITQPLIEVEYVDENNNIEVGMFGVAYGAKISNLGLIDVNVTGFSYVGGLVGWNESSTIHNCYSTGNVNSTKYTGGLVGVNTSSTMTNCYSECDIVGNFGAGGLIGGNDESSVINCHAVGNVSGNRIIGGLAGDNTYSSIISHSYATGNVSGSEHSVGGLVGSNYNDSQINNSYSLGNVSGGKDATGGLAGDNYSSFINNCYALGGVEGVEEVGGLVGANDVESNINNSYAAGKVIGSYRDFGGLIGYNDGTSTITNSFFDNETTGQTKGIGNNDSVTGAVGKTTTEMQTESTFTNASWDFTNTWEMLCYPVLQWEELSLPIIDTSITVDGPTLTATATDVGITYQWLDGDDNAISGATEQSYTATENGYYKVIITTHGCSQTSEAIEITNLSTKEINGIFDIKVYPNPTAKDITIDFPKTQTADITIYDISGKMVYKTRTFDKNVKLPINGKAGMYLVNINTADFNKTIKIIKQ